MVDTVRLGKDNASLAVVVSRICIGGKLRRNERRLDPGSGVASVLTRLATVGNRRSVFFLAPASRREFILHGVAIFERALSKQNQF